jgi:hypothetical protein
MGGRGYNEEPLVSKPGKRMRDGLDAPVLPRIKALNALPGTDTAE